MVCELKVYGHNSDSELCPQGPIVQLVAVGFILGHFPNVHLLGGQHSIGKGAAEIYMLTELNPTDRLLQGFSCISITVRISVF